MRTTSIEYKKAKINKKFHFHLSIVYFYCRNDSPLVASMCATQAPGSIGRTGSVRGIVK